MCNICILYCILFLNTQSYITFYYVVVSIYYKVGFNCNRYLLAKAFSPTFLLMCLPLYNRMNIQYFNQIFCCKIHILYIIIQYRCVKQCVIPPCICCIQVTNCGHFLMLSYIIVQQYSKQSVCRYLIMVYSMLCVYCIVLQCIP